MRAALLALALLTVSSSARAAIEVVVGADVPAGVAAVVDDSWQRLNHHWWVVTSTSPPWSARLTVRRAFSLSAQVAATSTPGGIELRSSSSSSSLTPEQTLALRHEVVHQHLWLTCPQAARDRLFHEAVAVALSGEAALWDSERYQTLPQTAETLRTADLDTPVARRALARLLREGTTTTTSATGPLRLPPTLRQKLLSCTDGAAWQPLTIEALVGLSAVPTGDALLVIHRATGEVIAQQGEIDRPLPFGSTLKPVLIAAALDRGATLPRLPRRPTDPTWSCGPSLSSTMDATEALQRSCNGWFLDWARQDPRAVDLGAWGTVLTAAGLSSSSSSSSLPTEMSEAIGARASMRLSPRGLAEVFRVLSYSRKRGGFDVVDVMRGRGTLDGADGVGGLEGMAAKTGTVRDEQSRAVLGWLVAFDEDVVIVRVRAGVASRTFVADVVAARSKLAPRLHDRVRVQVLGLVPVAEVRARCAVVAVVGSAPLQVHTTGEALLRDVVAADSEALCIGAPWRVPVAGETRPYAGTFRWSPPPALTTTTTTTATAKQQAARRGSSFVLTTSRQGYVRAVLDAEDAGIRGEARIALARVIDHNVEHGDQRHGGRPVCDTTHCQAFRGTPKRGDDVDGRAVVDALQKPLALTGWLPFSQGGTAPWREQRTRTEVTTAIGAFTALQLKDGVVVVVRSVDDASGSHDEAEAIGCERLRSPLRLPACPSSVDVDGNRFEFVGVGAGHGQGLDVEAAKKASAAGASADAILRSAFPLLPTRSR